MDFKNEEIFSDAIKEILIIGKEDLSTRYKLSSEWCNELLKEEEVMKQENLVDINKDALNELQMLFEQAINLNSKEENTKQTQLNLIKRPYYKQFSKNLFSMLKMKNPTFVWHNEISQITLLKCDPICINQIEILEEEISELKNALNTSFYNLDNLKNLEIRFPLAWKALKRFILQYITPRDVGLLLGLFETEGSFFRNFDSKQHLVLLPSLEQCLIAFSTCHKAKDKTSIRKGVRPTQLTSGARALTKHWHRDRTTYFWPQCSGSEPQKNTLANFTLLKLVTEMAWMNLHLLPGDKPAFEIRNRQGYGARWELFLILDKVSNRLILDKVIFRGLLEPPMQDGHLNNWTH